MKFSRPCCSLTNKVLIWQPRIRLTGPRSTQSGNELQKALATRSVISGARESSSFAGSSYSRGRKKSGFVVVMERKSRVGDLCPFFSCRSPEKI